MKICEVVGCSLKHLAGGYCEKHYIQIRRHGKTLKRTRFDKNAMYKKDDKYVMGLYDQKGELIAETKFDGVHIKEIEKYKWYLSDHGYAKSTISGKGYNLSNFVMGDFSQKYMFDHINRIRLNNLSENLRIATRGENAINKNICSNNKTGKTGVYWRKDRNKYYATISIDGNKKHLGCFTNIEDAISARQQVEVKYHKGFSPNAQQGTQ